jgi:hypothetical protein
MPAMWNIQNVPRKRRRSLNATESPQGGLEGEARGAGHDVRRR